MVRSDVVAERVRSQRAVQFAFGVLALVCLAFGLAFRAIAIQAGVPAEITDTVSLAFLLAAVLDLAVLLTWERLFPVET